MSGMKSFALCFVTIWLGFFEGLTRAENKVDTGHSTYGVGFTFPSVPAPANNDAATAAKFRLVDGDRDPNGGDLAVLHDGRVPSHDDQPAANFFFRAGIDGGRILIDLGKVIAVKQVASYSWHAGDRGPQVFKLYGADGTADGFQLEPKKPTLVDRCGWTLIAEVDTRPKGDNVGGQYGVAITNCGNPIGKFRYLLFDIAKIEARDTFGNTFFSEIDVIDADGPAPISTVEQPVLQSFATEDGKFRFHVDVTESPELADWSGSELRTVVQKWYPKIVEMLPSEGYQAPADILFRFRGDMGKTPASAFGAGVNLNMQWFRAERDREACGAVIHELVHVVQQYRQSSRDPKALPTPGWLVEGIADYIRWFQYEPQTKGAEITKQNLAGAKFDASYRISANFLNWVSQTYDKDLIRKLNGSARAGNYTESLWKDWTGRTVQELGHEWKAFHQQRIESGH